MDSALAPEQEKFNGWMQDLGGLMQLLQHAPLQQRYPLAVLRSRIFPAFWYGQYRLFWREGQPVAFINWAWLSVECSARYQASQCLLEATEWAGGSELWFMEMIALPGALPQLMHELRQYFPGRTWAHWHSPGHGAEPQYHRMQFPARLD